MQITYQVYLLSAEQHISTGGGPMAEAICIAVREHQIGPSTHKYPHMNPKSQMAGLQHLSIRCAPKVIFLLGLIGDFLPERDLQKMAESEPPARGLPAWFWIVGY